MHDTEAVLLKDAFQEFARASDSIISYYTALEGQIKDLREEVERKNKELERAREYLRDVLDSLPVGVAVIEKKNVVFTNKQAEQMDSGSLITGLNGGMTRSGETKTARGHFRWRKERLAAGFEGREVAVVEDVTELEKMKERLERDERLRAMGEMAARIAHEIKNPLGSMELFLSMLLTGSLKPKEKQYIEYVQYGAKTIDRIINNMLSYTRPRAIMAKEARLCDVVKDVLDFMSVSLQSRKIAVEYRILYDGDALFDPDLMKLVIMNLVSNAMEAMVKDGLLMVTVGQENGHAVLSVGDSGKGMTEEVRKNIFNPFFTTKEKGLGLGLFIVYNIINAQGGYIEVESKEGQGSAFMVFVPRRKV
jgi:signal transduction histidine kinase